jgi:hypothetical protein
VERFVANTGNDGGWIRQSDGMWQETAGPYLERYAPGGAGSEGRTRYSEGEFGAQDHRSVGHSHFAPGPSARPGTRPSLGNSGTTLRRTALRKTDLAVTDPGPDRPRHAGNPPVLRVSAPARLTAERKRQITYGNLGSAFEDYLQTDDAGPLGSRLAGQQRDGREVTGRSRSETMEFQLAAVMQGQTEITNKLLKTLKKSRDNHYGDSDSDEEATTSAMTVSTVSPSAADLNHPSDWFLQEINLGNVDPAGFPDILKDTTGRIVHGLWIRFLCTEQQQKKIKQGLKKKFPPKDLAAELDLLVTRRKDPLSVMKDLMTILKLLSSLRLADPEPMLLALARRVFPPVRDQEETIVQRLARYTVDELHTLILIRIVLGVIYHDRVPRMDIAEVTLLYRDAQVTTVEEFVLFIRSVVLFLRTREISWEHHLKPLLTKDQLLQINESLLRNIDRDPRELHKTTELLIDCRAGLTALLEIQERERLLNGAHFFQLRPARGVAARIAGVTPNFQDAGSYASQYQGPDIVNQLSVSAQLDESFCGYCGTDAHADQCGDGSEQMFSLAVIVAMKPCYNEDCRSTEHTMRTCSKTKCFGCGGMGHMRIDCKAQTTCPRCNQPGHGLEGCKREPTQGCFRCQGLDHQIRNCPNPSAAADGGCHRCGSKEHRVAHCPKPDQRTCWNCNQPGHRAQVCTAPRRAGFSPGGQGIRRDFGKGV